MNGSNEPQTIALGLLGAVIGGCIGYFAFFWIVKHGFYALVVPPGLLGFTAGLFARRRSTILGALCGVAGLGLGLFTEWRFAPFVADESLGYFLVHIYKLKAMTLIMLAFGTYLSYRLALGSDRQTFEP